MSARHLPAILALSALVAVPAFGADLPQLTVYAPDYFASDWGPGPAIRTAFEKDCECELVYVTGDVLPRILLEGDAHKADVVMGLTIDQTAQARASGLRVELLHYGLLTALSLTIVAAMTSAGLILAVALLIAPCAIAFLITRSFGRMLAVATLVWSGCSCCRRLSRACCAIWRS